MNVLNAKIRLIKRDEENDFYMVLEYNRHGSIIQSYCFMDNPVTKAAIMDIVGVSDIKDVAGKFIRVEREDRFIIRIGHLLEDKWYPEREVKK